MQDKLTKMRKSLTVISLLIGRPSTADNPWSAWAVVEQTQDRVQALGSLVSQLASSFGDRLAGIDASLLEIPALHNKCGRQPSMLGYKPECCTTVQSAGELLSAGGLVQGVGSAAQGIPLSEGRLINLESQLSALSARTFVELKSLKGCIGGQGVIAFEKWQFGCPKSCRSLLDCMNVVTPVWEYMVDLFHVLAMVRPVTRSADEVANKTIFTPKTLLTNPQLTCLASLQTSIPEDNLMADAGDGTHGTHNFVMWSVEALAPAYQSFESNYYELFQFAEYAFEQSLHALDELSLDIGQFHRNMLTMSFKSPPFTSKQERERCARKTNLNELDTSQCTLTSSLVTLKPTSRRCRAPSIVQQHDTPGWVISMGPCCNGFGFLGFNSPLQASIGFPIHPGHEIIQSTPIFFLLGSASFLAPPGWVLHTVDLRHSLLGGATDAGDSSGMLVRISDNTGTMLPTPIVRPSSTIFHSLSSQTLACLDLTGSSDLPSPASGGGPRRSVGWCCWIVGPSSVSPARCPGPPSLGSQSHGVVPRGLSPAEVSDLWKTPILLQDWFERNNCTSSLREFAAGLPACILHAGSMLSGVVLDTGLVETGTLWEIQKTRKFAVAKKIISPKTHASNPNNKYKTKGRQKADIKPRHVDQAISALFFRYNNQLGPPYHILIDTNFIYFSIWNKMEILRSMMDCVLAKYIPYIINCIMGELKKLGFKYKVV
ncbi:hypothetical protein HJC23_011903 [Cyclotella cryptica]|uniref:PIN domain-containing protein n=1 Tax=Cyclotella cryptica TaxID=29204 RepID=A0ABD3PLS5_9STRA